MLIYNRCISMYIDCRYSCKYYFNYILLVIYIFSLYIMRKYFIYYKMYEITHI